MKIQDKAIKHFKLNNKNPTKEQFYNEIMPETKFSSMLDLKLQKWGLRLFYFKRIKKNNSYIIDSQYLP
jgi:hypothetical protein